MYRVSRDPVDLRTHLRSVLDALAAIREIHCDLDSARWFDRFRKISAVLAAQRTLDCTRSSNTALAVPDRFTQYANRVSRAQLISSQRDSRFHSTTICLVDIGPEIVQLR